MPKLKKNDAGDNALQCFYKACGLNPKTIERAIDLRYSEPPRSCPRHSDIARRMRHERVKTGKPK
jgi:hypothetical protein